MADSPLLNSTGTLTLSILSAGAEISDEIQVVSVEVSQRINRIPTAIITFLDGDMPTDSFPVSDMDSFTPGTAVTINAGYGGVETAIFQGIVVKHGIKIGSDNHARLVIECKDQTVAMTVGRKNANYIDSKDSDIISKLVGAYSGLSVDVTATDTTYKELVQYYCSDWDFMMVRAEANGLLVMVDAGKISVKAPATSGSAALTVTYGTDLIEFQAEIDARTQLSSVTGTSWDLATQAILQQQASPEALTGQGNLDAATLAQVIGLSSYNLQSPASLESTALTAWAKGQQIKSGLARVRGHMRFQGSALAVPGALIELKGVGTRFNGNVLASAVTHTIVNGNWITKVEFGMSPAWFSQNEDVNGPRASGLTPAISGLHIGVVKKLDADPEGQYKIQVSIPVMQAETDGVWARLASFYGSDGFGAFFIPEIGDEVILGYFNNDPSYPVILGSLYSSKRKPAYEPTADNFIKAIVTKSKLKLEFDDDKKIITLVTPGKNTVVISDDGKSILLQDQNSNKVELNSSGITLDSPKDITINAQGKITITAVGNVEITANADIKNAGLNIEHSAKVGFTAKGAATAELSASGQTTVKGAMVMIN
jgi:Rhs element Vgr protein